MVHQLVGCLGRLVQCYNCSIGWGVWLRCSLQSFSCHCSPTLPPEHLPTLTPNGLFLCLERIKAVQLRSAELSICYMGRAVSFIMYNPRKHIKHHIKEFAVCCAYTTVLLGFEVYCGNSDDLDGSSLGVVKRLLQKSYLSQVCGRVLYREAHNIVECVTGSNAMEQKKKGLVAHVRRRMHVSHRLWVARHVTS
jgi:hypothetical protein